MGKKILVFNDCFYMGGTEILLVNLLNHLIEKNHEVTLLLPNPSDQNILLGRVSKQVVIKYIFDKELTGIKDTLYRNILIFYPRIYQRLIGFNPAEYDKIICFKDCFHSIMFSRMNVEKYLWIQNHPFQTIYNSKSIKEYFAFILNRVQIKRRNKSFDNFDKIICVSDSSKREYIKIYNNGIQKKELIVLYNALDLSGIAQRAEEPIDLPELSCCISFVIVIRLSHEKTVDRAIIATDRLRKEGYKFKILILGYGAEYDKLKEMIKNYQLESYITMFGRVSNPFPFMKKCTWLLCPSSRESFSLVLLEAISLGTPVITTDCGGPEDVIDHGKYGIFTENSLEGVYNAMKKVLDNPDLLPYYQSKRDENLARFDYTKWIESVDSILGIK